MYAPLKTPNKPTQNKYLQQIRVAIALAIAGMIVFECFAIEALYHDRPRLCLGFAALGFALLLLTLYGYKKLLDTGDDEKKGTSLFTM
jgi:hypothetical protein